MTPATDVDLNMEKYDERTKQIAQMTMKGMTQTLIAKTMGISKQRIGQLIDKAEKAGFNVMRRQIKKSNCKSCGKEYKRNMRKFCSPECRMSFPRKFGGPSSSIEVEIMTCDGCGTRFSRTKRLTYIRNKTSARKGKVPNRVFCTRECYSEHGVIRK
jgi:predicted DNA-binding protein (UPF0251 family)